LSEGDGEGFLSRWSRRKRAGEKAPPSPPAAPPTPPGPETPPSFDPASLPPLESLTAESDFTAFLREEVPAALRRAALRRAWTLDPAIRDFVGPADYAWDFNAPDGGMPGFSPELEGDVKRLIAQAIGLEEAPAEEKPDEAPRPPAALAEIAAPVSDSPPLLSGPEAPSPDEPAPDRAHAQAISVAEPPPVRRRHGGALPS
jgi:Protein of unknown function (DUF3306)